MNHGIASFIIEVVDGHDWLVTLFVGLFALYLYWMARIDARMDAAKLILQEIRYADQKVRNYRTYSSYNFTEKILPTNSWNKNINFFIRKLTESELDLISKFFSSATYLDSVISAISEAQNGTLIGTSQSPVEIEGIRVATGTGNIPEPAKKLIEAISKDIESIYNTPAADKLRQLSDRKWYHFV